MHACSYPYIQNVGCTNNAYTHHTHTLSLMCLKRWFWNTGHGTPHQWSPKVLKSMRYTRDQSLRNVHTRARVSYCTMRIICQDLRTNVERDSYVPTWTRSTAFVLGTRLTTQMIHGRGKQDGRPRILGALAAPQRFRKPNCRQGCRQYQVALVAASGHTPQVEPNTRQKFKTSEKKKCSRKQTMSWMRLSW